MSVLVLEHLPGPPREGLIGYLHHPESGWVFRVTLWRDPDQPRFWCLRIDVCTPATLRARVAAVDPFYCGLGRSRDEAARLLTRIQAEPAIWLNDTEQGALRRWVTQVVQLPLPKPPSHPPRASTHRRLDTSVNTAEAPAMSSPVRPPEPS